MAEETKIRFYRNPYASLTTGLEGQPRYATDAKRFYMSDGSALVKIGPGAVASGSTLPTVNLTAGDFFLHNPTGRAYLMQYDGSTWRPILSYGSTTVYVNGTSGSDTQNKGFGTGADAYDTIQYAIDQLPPLLSGSVTINVAAGTYAENVTLQGKQATANYEITLEGALNQYGSHSAGVGSVAGTGATQGTVVRGSGTWTSNEIQNKFIRFTSGGNSGYSLLVDSNDTTTATMVGAWPGGAPANGDTFVVEDQGANAVKIAPASGTVLAVQNGHTAMVLRKVWLDGADNTSAVSLTSNSRLTAKLCRLTNGGTAFQDSILQLGADAAGDGCLVEYGDGNIYGDRVLYAQRSQINAHYSKILGTGTLDYGYVYGLQGEAGSLIYADYGTVLEGQVTGGSPSNGIYCNGNANAIVEGAAVSNVRVRTWDRGVRAEGGGQVSTYSVSYSGNTTNESADAGTYGYIA